ncbi:MAG TPA: hypothetical protein VLT47_11010 [Anaeromyxobacteraceae bacterium]|nr:hypothetical protein [Anaeromyxobacteraceae bacterium]
MRDIRIAELLGPQPRVASAGSRMAAGARKRAMRAAGQDAHAYAGAVAAFAASIARAGVRIHVEEREDGATVQAIGPDGEVCESLDIDARAAEIGGDGFDR